MCSQGRGVLSEVGFPALPDLPSHHALQLHCAASLWLLAGSASTAGGCGLLDDPGLVGTMVRRGGSGSVTCLQAVCFRGVDERRN